MKIVLITLMLIAGLSASAQHAHTRADSIRNAIQYYDTSVVSPPNGTLAEVQYRDSAYLYRYTGNKWKLWAKYKKAIKQTGSDYFFQNNVYFVNPPVYATDTTWIP